MKKKMLMPLLCLLLLILLLGVYFILKNNKKEEGESTESAETIAVNELDASQVASVSFLVEGEEKKFVRQEETWQLEGDGSFPLDESKINTVVNRSCGLTAERRLDDVEDLSEYGLQDPSNCITLVTSDGTERRIYVGDKNKATGNTYIYMDDQKTLVYIVSVDYASVIPEHLMDMALGEEYPTITSTNISQIEIKKNDNNITLKSNSDKTNWTVAGNDEKEYTADSQIVSTLQSTITGLQFKSLVDYSGQNPGKYGLGEPSASICVKYSETAEDSGDDSSASSESTSATKEDSDTTVEKELILLIGDKDDTGDYYVQLDGSNEVHTMSSDSIDEILGKDHSDYWSLAVGSVPVADISGITVEYQGVTSEIVRNSVENEDEEGNKTTAVTYTCKEQEIDKTQFETFYNKLIAMTAQSKEESLPTAQDTFMKVTFHTESGDKVVSYTSYDENFYLARDVEGRMGLVGKTNVKEMFDSYEKLDLK